MPDEASTAADKALILEMNQLITAEVESVTHDDGGQEPKQYLVYFDSPMNGRRLYLLTDDENQADAARRHIDKYFETRKLASVVVLDIDAMVDEVPKYASADALYQDLWW